MTAGQRTLLVVGRSCAGKSTMGRHLADEHEAHFVEASEVLGQVLGELPGALHRTPPAGFAYGQVADRIVELIRKRDARLIVVSGLRTMAEYARLVEYAPHTELVYVHAPPLLRFQRCQSRLRHDAVALPSAFRMLDANAEHSLLPMARGLARCVLPNRGSMEEYRSRIDTIIDGTACLRSGPLWPAAAAGPALPSSARTSHRIG